MSRRKKGGDAAYNGHEDKPFQYDLNSPDYGERWRAKLERLQRSMPRSPNALVQPRVIFVPGLCNSQFRREERKKREREWDIRTRDGVSETVELDPLDMVTLPMPKMEEEPVPQHLRPFKECCQAAKTGDVQAQYELGWMYEHGHSVPANEHDAVRWYRRAASKKHRMASLALARCYALHKAKTRLGDKVAVPLFLYASYSHDDTLAQYNLGVLLNFLPGHATPTPKSVRWFRLAAKKGHAASMRCLGMLYVRGDGVRQNMRVAATWFKMAAGQGDIESHFLLGRCYLIGRGTHCSYAKAKEHLSIAANAGHKRALRTLDILCDLCPRLFY